MNLSAAAEPALDPTDEQAIALALRAIKMSEHDLAFSKTNVESELVLQKARTFLQQPLTLPAHVSRALSNLQAVTSLEGLEHFTREQLEVLPARIFLPAPVIELDPNFRAKLPAPVVRALQGIVNAAAHARQALKQGLPPDSRAAFAAFAAESFQLDKDKPEFDAWDRFGLDTTGVRAVVQRGDALELQDGELANEILSASDKLNPPLLFHAFWHLSRAVDEAVADLRAQTFTNEFQYETETDLGKIIVGGAGRNVYTNEAFLILDLGGDDVYENSAGGANGLAGRPVSIVIDLAGNDQYISTRSFSQGAGVFGIGILVDCAGDDVYEAKHLSQGAGLFGCGVLADYGGRDKFVADTFCQGAAEFGAGILWQRGGDTSYRAAQLAQGFGGTSGAGLLLDCAGNDSYFAGGKYPCDWLPGHNFSLSQGFGYGMRPFAGGGVGILCDLQGDDHYTADVYGQGASYWYAVGMLLDAEGDDTYDAYQYCQGAGIHLSSGALVDWAGNDSYLAGHICQGAAHDYSVGMLIDRSGDDKYTGETTAQGSALNNSVALLLDRAGNDTYVGKDPKQSQAAGHDGDKREYGSVALMLDLSGEDTYSQGQSNNAVWVKPWYGAGLDAEWKTGKLQDRTIGGLEEWKDAEAVFVPRPEASARRLYKVEPVDPRHPVERLLRRAISDKPDARVAWDELRHLGTEALPYLLTRLDSPNVSVRAKIEELIDHLGTNSIPALIAGIDSASSDETARLCCYFLARFNKQARAAIPHVLPLLKRDLTRPVAFYTLGHLRAQEAFGSALAALNERELVRLRAVQTLGRIGDRRAIPKLIPKLDDEFYDIRYAAETALVALGKPSIGALRNVFAKASPRARPHIITVLAKLGDRRALALAREHYRHENPLVPTAVEKELASQLATASGGRP